MNYNLAYIAVEKSSIALGSAREVQVGAPENQIGKSFGKLGTYFGQSQSPGLASGGPPGPLPWLP